MNALPLVPLARWRSLISPLVRATEKYKIARKPLFGAVLGVGGSRYSGALSLYTFLGKSVMRTWR